MFGQVINRVGNIADFIVINRVRVLGSGPHTLTQFFWERSLSIYFKTVNYIHLAFNNIKS